MLECPHYDVKLIWLFGNNSHQLALLFLSIGLHELKSEAGLRPATCLINDHLFVVHVIHYYAVVE